MAYLNDDDLMRLIREIKDYVNSSENYSYVELEEYARLNNQEWYDALKHSRTLRGHIANYLQGARRKQIYNGEHPRTRLQSVDKIIKEREERGEL
jgi:macrodomain Ter protein organizer (MatP/YcbG family)